MDAQTLRKNAEKIKANGLDEKIEKISKEASEIGLERARNISFWKMGEAFPCDLYLPDILGLCGGSVKGLKVLDLGCGDGEWYAPVLSEALSYLGANVTGLDMEQRDKERFGFNYVRTNLLYTSENDLFKDKDIVIAKALLNNGLRFNQGDRYSFVSSDRGDLIEWMRYKRIIQNVRAVNKKDALYVLQTPLEDIFINPFNTIEEAKEIKKSEIKEIAKEILLGDVNGFYSHFYSL